MGGRAGTVAVRRGVCGPCARARTMRVYSVSDLHVDHAANARWVDAVEDHGGDSCLVVAGDVSATAGRVVRTLASLRRKFGRVFFVPGNHDLWLGGHEDAGDVPFRDSLAKLEALERMCAAVGVETRPGFIGQGDAHPCCVVPLHAWYCARFDREPDLPGPLRAQPTPASDLTVDSFRCLWPPLGEDHRPAPSAFPSPPPRRCPDGTEVCAAMDARNEDGWDDLVMAVAMEARCEALTFSHFLPRPELLPEKRFLLHPNLARVVGSDLLGARVRALRPALHVFGHTHLVWDMVLDGTRFVQWPLASPREQQRRAFFSEGASQASLDPGAPLLLFDTRRDDPTTGVCVPDVGSSWCAWYRDHARDPGSARLAPYTAMLYRGVDDPGEVEDDLPAPLLGREEEAAELLWRDMQRASPPGMLGSSDRASPASLLLYPSAGRRRAQSMRESSGAADEDNFRGLLKEWLANVEPSESVGFETMLFEKNKGALLAQDGMHETSPPPSPRPRRRSSEH